MADDRTTHRTLRALDTLWAHFAEGLTAAEVASLSGLNDSSAVRALQQLAAAGYAEQIEETKRWRISHRIGRQAMLIWRSIDAAQQRLADSRARLGIDNN